MGRQWHFEVDGDDFYIDLLFFNWVQSRFVVVELKIEKFAPEHAGQLGFYVAWVEDNLRRPDLHAETVGILLCGDRNDRVVRYSLAGATAPLAVATYDALPPAILARRLQPHRVGRGPVAAADVAQHRGQRGLFAEATWQAEFGPGAGDP